MKYNCRKTGSLYEQKAADFLEKQGLMILEHNYRCRFGEIDLIAKDGQYLVFIEVKYRKDGLSGRSLEAVTPAKQRVIGRVAQLYLTVQYRNENVPCRFDVIGIDGDRLYWEKNAFEYHAG